MPGSIARAYDDFLEHLSNAHQAKEPIHCIQKVACTCLRGHNTSDGHADTDPRRPGGWRKCQCGKPEYQYAHSLGRARVRSLKSQERRDREYQVEDKRYRRPIIIPPELTFVVSMPQPEDCATDRQAVKRCNRSFPRNQSQFWEHLHEVYASSSGWVPMV